jgi:hypothetical protein
MLCALLRNAVARKAAASTCCCTARRAPARPSSPRWRAGRGPELYEVEYADRDGNSLSGRDRYRSLQISQVFLKGSADVALLFDEVEDVFPPLAPTPRS